jgi:hypothetical protein
MWWRWEEEFDITDHLRSLEYRDEEVSEEVYKKSLAFSSQVRIGEKSMEAIA